MDSDGRPETELIQMQNASALRPKCPADRLSAETMWARDGRGPSLKWTAEEGSECVKSGVRATIKYVNAHAPDSQRGTQTPPRGPIGAARLT